VYDTYLKMLYARSQARDLPLYWVLVLKDARSGRVRLVISDYDSGKAVYDSETGVYDCRYLVWDNRKFFDYDTLNLIIIRLRRAGCRDVHLLKKRKH
jgi:hypothetical protein